MWECASPNPVRFTVLNCVSEADGFDGAFVAEGFGQTDRILSGVAVRVILREKHLGDILARCTASLIVSVRQMTVGCLSVLAHNIILEEDDHEW